MLSEVHVVCSLKAVWGARAQGTVGYIASSQSHRMWHSARLAFPHNHFIKRHGCNHICISYKYHILTYCIQTCQNWPSSFDCVVTASSIWVPGSLKKIKTITVMSSYHVARFCKRLYGMIACTIFVTPCLLSTQRLKGMIIATSNIFKHIYIYIYIICIYIYICMNVYSHIHNLYIPISKISKYLFNTPKSFTPSKRLTTNPCQPTGPGFHRLFWIHPGKLLKWQDIFGCQRNFVLK